MNYTYTLKKKLNLLKIWLVFFDFFKNKKVQKLSVLKYPPP